MKENNEKPTVNQEKSYVPDNVYVRNVYGSRNRSGKPDFTDKDLEAYYLITEGMGNGP